MKIDSVIHNLPSITLLLLSILIALLIIIFWISKINLKNQKRFQLRIHQLEKIIVDLTETFENQSKKVQLSDQFQFSMKTANQELSNKIVDMNNDVFGELFKKK